MKSRKVISALLLSALILSPLSCSSNDPAENGTTTSEVTTTATDKPEEKLPENTLGLVAETESTDLLFNYGLAPVLVDDKWGFINEKGEIVIEPTFDKPDKFRQGVLAVNENGKYRFMNTEGEWISEPEDGIAGCFTEYYCLVRTVSYDKDGNVTSTKEKFIDSSGRVAIELPENTSCWPVRDGMILARSEKGLSVYNVKGEKLFTLEGVNTFAGDESTYRCFFDGLLCVKDSKTEKWGAVNTKGEWVFEPKFDYMNHFEDGMAYAQEGEYGGFINTKGDWVIEPTFKKNISTRFCEGLAGVETDDSAGYIDKEGNLAVKLDGFEWVLTWEFDNGVASVDTDQGSGIIDKNGKWIVSPSYYSIGRFNCGLAPVETEFGKHEFINSSGELVSKANYLAAERLYDDGYGVALRSDGKWLIVNEHGKVFLEGNFDGVGNYYSYHNDNGTITVCVSGR